MFTTVSRYLALCHKGFYYHSVKNSNISSLSTVKDFFFPCCHGPSTKVRVTSLQQRCLHTVTRKRKQLQRPMMGSNFFERKQQCYYSGKFFVHCDDVGSSARLEMKLQTESKRKNKQKLMEKDSELCKQRNKLQFNDNIYISEPWTSIGAESILEYQSKSENGDDQPCDILSKDSFQFHNVEEVSPFNSSNRDVSMEATNKCTLKHMPNFREVTEIYYTVTRKELLRKKFVSLYSKYLLRHYVVF